MFTTKEATIATISIIIGVIVFSVGLVSLLNWMSNKQCLTAYSNFEPQWGFFSKCRIVVDGKLTPVEIVRELK